MESRGTVGCVPAGRNFGEPIVRTLVDRAAEDIDHRLAGDGAAG
jgi:hypothetical protein